MSDALTIANSALNVQSLTLNVVADNVANAETPGYQEKQVELQPMNPGVSVASVAQTTQSVDLVDQTVSLINARAAYNAALNVVSADKHMTGALLGHV